MKKVAVIGAGIAGIAAGLRLRQKGYEVEVFESNDHPGGKLTHFEKNGFRFDAGPSLFTRPDLVTELFELFGKSPEKFFQFKKKDTICNYFWEDGIAFSVPADRQLFIERAEKLFNVRGEKIATYLDKSERKYRLTSPIFLEKSLHKFATYFSPDTVRALFHVGDMDIFKSLDTTNRHALGEPHLVQLFNRYATYNGSSPYKTPGIMSMIPYLEFGDGTFFPHGGMISITNSLFELATSQGIRFHFNREVSKIIVDRNRVRGVETVGGIRDADIVICNADIHSTYKKLLSDQPQPKKILQQERSSSALIFYWGMKTTSNDLDLHNIFFSDNYSQEFSHIFDQKQLYHDPTVYVNITSKEEPSDAPEGCENWFVMINAPGDFGQNWEKEIDSCRSNIIHKLERILKRELKSQILSETTMDPRVIEKRTNSHNGSLYGTSSNSRYAAFLRHANFTGRIRNLFFCGGSVHPGGGIPLCLSSAKIVCDMIADPQ